MSHWHNTTSVSVPGPVDPDGCCADEPNWMARQTKD